MPDYKLEVLKVVGDGYETIDPAFAGWKITNADIGDKIPAKGEKSSSGRSNLKKLANFSPPFDARTDITLCPVF